MVCFNEFDLCICPGGKFHFLHKISYRVMCIAWSHLKKNSKVLYVSLQVHGERQAGTHMRPWTLCKHSGVGVEVRGNATLSSCFFVLLDCYLFLMLIAFVISNFTSTKDEALMRALLLLSGHTAVQTSWKTVPWGQVRWRPCLLPGTLVPDLD